MSSLHDQSSGASSSHLDTGIVANGGWPTPPTIVNAPKPLRLWRPYLRRFATLTVAWLPSTSAALITGTNPWRRGNQPFGALEWLALALLGVQGVFIFLTLLCLVFERSKPVIHSAQIKADVNPRNLY